MILLQKVLGSEKKYKMQYRALHLLLFFGMILGIIACIVNTFTTSNFYNIVMPLIASMFCGLLFYYARNGKRPYFSKIAFIIFIDFVYFPLGWITSAGSLSSMPYYSILFLVVTFLIIEYQSEYIFPVLFVIEAVFLMYIELRWPFIFEIYKSSNARIIDIGIHYAIVTIFMGTIFAILLNKYMEISRGYTRQNITDELTGFYNRTFGIKELQKAFEETTRTDVKYAVILFRLHDMKHFNQINGPLDGDEFIRSLSGIMLDSSRSNDVCCRYHGSEFLVLLSHTDITQVEVYLSRIYDAFYNLESKYNKSSLKLLVGKADFDYNDINEVMRVAEQDLEIAKNELLQNKE